MDDYDYSVRTTYWVCVACRRLIGGEEAFIETHDEDGTLRRHSVCPPRRA